MGWCRRSCRLPSSQMIDSRRCLPHWVPDGVPVFVTFRLAGSLPGHVRARLNRTESGPMWLRDERVADMLVEALRYGASVKQWYALHAYVIMPNHVHLVWTPTTSMSRVLQRLKGVTSRRAKRLLDLSEEAFWQPESVDHWIRSDTELQRTIDYVEWNPVKAGLVHSAEEWPWSSAYCKEPKEPADTRSSALPNLSRVNQPVPDCNSSIRISRRFRIMRNHQNRLTGFTVQKTQQI
jgi:putative transposase